MDELRSRLLKCFSAVFPDVGSQGLDEMTKHPPKEWDSMAMLLLFTIVEEEFNLRVDHDAFRNGLSFGLLLDYLNTNTNRATL